MSNLSQRLIQLQTERKLLKKDIAKANNISIISYYRYETGERQPTADIIIKLCNYFNVSSDYLLGLSDDPTRH